MVNASFRGDSTKERIKSAAVRLFARNGFEATAIRDIAEAAQVSTSSLYHYMENKDELLTDIMITAMVKLIKCSVAVVDPGEAPPARLVALVRCHVGLQIIDRLAALVTDNEIRSLRDDDLRTVLSLRDEYESYWTKALIDGREQGYFSLEAPKLARLGLLEMCNGVARWFKDDGPLRIWEIEDYFATFALSMVNAQNSERPLCVDDVTPVTAKEFHQRLVELFNTIVTE